MVSSFSWLFYTVIFVEDFKRNCWPSLVAYLALTKTSLQAFKRYGERER